MCTFVCLLSSTNRKQLISTNLTQNQHQIYRYKFHTHCILMREFTSKLKIVRFSDDINYNQQSTDEDYNLPNNCDER